MVWILVVGFFIAFSFYLGDIYLNFTNLSFILYTSSILGLLVLAEGIALISGNFDLSVGQNAGLSVMVVGVLMVHGLPGYFGILAAVLIGAALGAFNGFFVGKIGLNPFLVTLSTYLMFDWTTFVIRKTSILTIPDTFMFLGGGKIGGIYVAIFIFIIAAVFLFFVLKKTTFGNHIYAVGGDPRVSKMLGIDTGNTIFWVFVIAGALSGLSGMLYAGFSQAITSTLADGTVFMAFAGAIIGGISLRGGRGGPMGAVGGILLVGIITAGLTMMMIPPAWQGFYKGALVFVAILINRFRGGLRDRILMP